MDSAEHPLTASKGERAAWDIEEHIKSLRRRYPTARLHVIYEGPLVPLMRAASRFRELDLIVYERLSRGEARCFVPTHAFPGEGGRVLVGDAPRIAVSAATPARGLSDVLHFLVLADEWFSHKGGISTFNRDLCLALAAAGHKIYVLIPALSLPHEDRRALQSHSNITWVHSELEGVSADQEFVMLPRLPGPPPDVIIGHGTITGREAVVQKRNFPKALHVHVVHVAPNDVERSKGRLEAEAMMRAEDKEEAQVLLCSEADLVVAVGPLLAKEVVSKQAVYGVGPAPVHRLDPWLPQREDEQPAVGHRDNACLLIGRAHDHHLKGLAIAARAIAALDAEARPKLLVRGVSPDDAEVLVAAVKAEVGDAVTMEAWSYTTSARRIAASFRRVRLALMPSLAEGFGLVGLEAIAHRTPVLVSGNSGLGLYLEQEVSSELARAAVVPVTKDDATDTTAWSRKIAAILDKPGGALADARALYQELAPRMRAEDRVREFVERLRQLVK